MRTSGVKSEVIIVGDRTWIKPAGAAAWSEKPGNTAVDSVATGDIVASRYLKAARNVELVDQKDEKYHLKFDLDLLDFARANNISGIDPEMFKGKEAQMEVWVNKKNLFLDSARMEFATHLAAPTNTDIRMSNEIDFSDFNEPVSIEPPE
jgi:hypothetical protein